MRRRTKKRRRMELRVCFIVVAALLVTMVACSSKNNKGEIESSQTPVVSDDGKPLDYDDVLLKVGQEDVTYRELSVYLFQLKERYEPTLGEGIWDYPIAENQTFEQVAKEELFKQITQIKIITSQAEKLGIQLTEDDMFEVKSQTKEYYSKLSQEEIEQYGLTEEVVTQVIADNYLADKTFAVTTNEVNTNISDQEARQMRLQQIVILTNGEDRDGNSIAMNEEQKQAALARANKLCEEAKTAADYEAFANTNSDIEQVTIYVGNDSRQELTGVAMAMQQDEISNVITVPEGYIILKCISTNDEEATANKKEELIANKQNEVFEEKYKTWSSDYKITQNVAKWSKITLK